MRRATQLENCLILEINLLQVIFWYGYQEYVYFFLRVIENTYEGN
jgi:hypothetical protein